MLKISYLILLLFSLIACQSKVQNSSVFFNDTAFKRYDTVSLLVDASYLKECYGRFELRLKSVRIYDKATVFTLGGKRLKNLTSQVKYLIRYGNLRKEFSEEFDFSTSDQPVAEKRIFTKAFEGFLRERVYRFQSTNPCLVKP